MLGCDIFLVQNYQDHLYKHCFFTYPAYSGPPQFNFFKTVSDEEIQKAMIILPTKSCLFDPWSTFLVKKCLYVPVSRLFNLLIVPYSKVLLLLVSTNRLAQKELPH